MINIFRNIFKRIDQQILACVIILLFCSLMFVTTSSFSVARKIGAASNYFLIKHIYYIIFSIVTIFILSLANIKFIKRISIFGFLISIIMLILVKFYGIEIKGAKRWLNIFGFSYQPSEFLKPFFAVTIAWILSIGYRENFPSIKLSLFCYIIVSCLLIIQPDFGMLVLITANFFIQLFLFGINFFFLLGSIILGGLGLVIAYYTMPHVALRIDKFLNPQNYENYQVNKSIAAIKKGGLYGIGPGEGTVKKHLPDSHTDFIFSASVEEFGIIFGIIIILLYSFICLKILISMQEEEDKFIQFSSISLICLFSMQAIINIGVTLSLFPTKGMTLPLISYGGSSMISTAILIGFILSFSKRKTTLFKYVK